MNSIGSEYKCIQRNLARHSIKKWFSQRSSNSVKRETKTGLDIEVTYISTVIQSSLVKVSVSKSLEKDNDV